MSSVFCSALTFFISVSFGLGFNWQDSRDVRWAMGCDFHQGDVANERSSGEQCGGKCEANPSCTHFTWTNYDGGKCWMKSGSIAESNAIALSRDGAVCGYLKSRVGGGGGGGNEHQMTFSNNCPFTVWVGALGQHVPKNGGWRLNAGESNQLSLGAGWQGRFWGRTECDSSGRCATGDCGGKIECRGAGGIPPATLAEFKFDGHGGLDYYDVSLVDGYNLPMSIKPNKGGGGGSKYNCGTAGCTSDLNSICPNELKVQRSGHTVACKSACEAFNTDEYCCRGAHNRPETCKASRWPINYAALFKRACPDAYSYAYDDTLSTFTCASNNPTSGYTIKFCP